MEPLAGGPGHLPLLAALEGQHRHRRHEGRYVFLLLHHLPDRPAFRYGKRRHHPRPVDRQHPAGPPPYDLWLHSLPRHRRPFRAPHPGHPHLRLPPPRHRPVEGLNRQGNVPVSRKFFRPFPDFSRKIVDKPPSTRYTNRAALNGSKCAQTRHPRQRARNEGVEIRE